MQLRSMSVHGEQSIISKLQEQLQRTERSLERTQDNNVKLKDENVELKKRLQEQDKEIKDLKEALSCKEEQRKKLAETIWKKRVISQGDVPLGKKAWRSFRELLPLRYWASLEMERLGGTERKR